MKRLASFGQHFLRSPQLVAELIGHTSIKTTDTVYDIGAGTGIISSVLAHRAGHVVAIEYEVRTAEKLRANMAPYQNVTVLEGDFLTLPLPTGIYKVFANIPFHLSSLIVRRLTEADHPPRAIYLIVQRQFARKLIVSSDHFTSELGIQLAPLFTAKIRKPLARSDFWPRPAVDTVFFELIVREEPLIPRGEMASWRDFVTHCFSRQVYFQELLSKYGSQLGVSRMKPSELSLEQWQVLFKTTLSSQSSYRTS